MELDLEGNLIGRWTLGRDDRPFKVAFTADARLYAEFGRTLAVFDRAKSSWNTVERTPEDAPLLLGAQDGHLVFSGSGGRLFWIKAAR